MLGAVERAGLPVDEARAVLEDPTALRDEVVSLGCEFLGCESITSMTT